MNVNPYLNFDGNCAEAFRFYEKTFGGKIEMMMTLGQSPMAAEMPKELHNQVMHVCMSMDGAQIMGSDACGQQYEKPRGLWVSLHPAEPAEAERLYNALADGGAVAMPLQQTFWARRFGMVTDRFGTPWMINCADPDMKP